MSTRNDSASYWVYILLCANNTYYTGITNNLDKRFKSHVDGSSKCKYTRSFKPIKISQTWEVSEGKAKALKIERYIKQLSRVEKEIIIAEPLSLQSIFNL
ncbi:GIY-YIG nuclease family protein [Legionella jamestowniensis]|uniref:Nuclease n=1 Tax=Legionella jamestowniensis TaxID=455 RepID=A0A0W0UGV8_9GAMM|nr:GIY-YIG nuclease family protein [Legionella jamestowniensis]KTD07075.1 nuclease [Legionella jamestowniensis]SFL70565.1 putative endonuclease [Legionella jamestowniensis DSM 19215]